MNKEKLVVEMYGNPEIDVRDILPTDNEETRKDKQKFPFIAKEKAVLKVAYLKDDNLFTTAFSNPRNFKFDGATIPFGIGKGNMKLLIPALFHDLICTKKEKVHYNRRLSSLIFKELLIQCGVNKIIANTMYYAVDLWQRTIREWKLGEKQNG